MLRSCAYIVVSSIVHKYMHIWQQTYNCTTHDHYTTNDAFFLRIEMNYSTDQMQGIKHTRLTAFVSSAKHVCHQH